MIHVDVLRLTSFVLRLNMSKPSKNLITAIIILCVVALIVGVKVFNQNNAAENSIDTSHIKGDLDAPIQIVEFIDFQCPACAFGAKFLNKFMKENPHKVRLEIKHFPLKMHAHAHTAALYVECAARQDKLWPLHDEMVNNQDKWKNLNNPNPAFQIMVEKAQLDKEKFNQCTQDEMVKDYILENKTEGQSRGVKSTPSYFVDGELIVGGQNLKKKLDQLLKDLET